MFDIWDKVMVTEESMARLAWTETDLEIWKIYTIREKSSIFFWLEELPKMYSGDLFEAYSKCKINNINNVNYDNWYIRWYAEGRNDTLKVLEKMEMNKMRADPILIPNSTIMIDIETIIASAININGAIIVGKRHCDCIKSAVESGIGKAPIRSSGQWFYTSKFRFVDREEAKQIAVDSWQCWATNSELLFSEDLR